MTDRRQIPDRRCLPTRPHGSGRRESDPEPSHGTRARYQKLRCRCTPCRAANATYEADYRKLKRDGKQPLGAKVSAVDTWRLIRQLRTDDVSEADVAERTGLSAKSGRLRLPSGRCAFVTLRSALKVQLVFRELMVGASDSL